MMKSLIIGSMKRTHILLDAKRTDILLDISYIIGHFPQSFIDLSIVVAVALPLSLIDLGIVVAIFEYDKHNEFHYHLRQKHP